MNAFIQKAGTHVPATQNHPALLQCLRKPFFGALLLFCLAFPAAMLLGQNITSHDLSEFAHGVTQVGVSGDTLRFVFWLGAEAEPAENVAGHELTVSLSGLEAYPPIAFATVEDSWVSAGAPNTNVVNSYDPTTGELTFTYLRDDEEGQTGYGVIATISFVMPGGFDDPATVVLNSGGGLVMVDNADFRKSPAAAGWGFGFGMAVAPNPAEDHLNVQVANPSGAELALIDMQGRIVRSLPCEAMQTLDVSGLKPGMYWVKVQGTESEEVKKVMILSQNH